MTKQTRIVVIVGSVLAVLLIATIVVVGILIGTLNRQQDEADYRACMHTLGVDDMTSVEDMADAAEWCSTH